MTRDIIKFNDPFSGLMSMHRELDSMFNNFFSQPMPPTLDSVPAMDVYTEDDKQLVAEVHLPGFSKEDVELNVHEGALEIKGKKEEKEEQKDKKRTYMVRQSSASFYRRIMLPKEADAGNIRADFKDGVLKVTVPFKELPAPKRITIGNGK